jgi:hypothetical protein
VTSPGMMGYGIDFEQLDSERIGLFEDLDADVDEGESSLAVSGEL